MNLSMCKTIWTFYNTKVFVVFNHSILLRKDKLNTLVKAYGVDFKKTLVYDRIKEDLRKFCANNTIDDVYNVKFLEIVEQVKENVQTSISRLGEVGEIKTKRCSFFNLGRNNNLEPGDPQAWDSTGYCTKLQAGNDSVKS